MPKSKRIDPLIAKAIKKKDYSIDKSRNYVGDYKIHSVYGKGKTRITVIDAVQNDDLESFSNWVKRYNVHVYTEQPVNVSYAIGQATLMKKNVVYIKHGIPIEDLVGLPERKENS